MLCRLASLGIVLLAAVIRPHRAQCPQGRDLRLGVRRDGRFACWSAPLAPRGWDAARRGPITEWDGTYGRPDLSVQRDDALDGRVYCWPGTVPIVELDGRTVRCR